MTEGAVRNWLQGHNPRLDICDANICDAIAEGLDVLPFRIQVLCGYGSSASELIELLDDLQDTNERLMEVIGRASRREKEHSGLTQLARAISRTGQLSFRIHPWWRGTRRRCHYADWVIFDERAADDGEVTQELLEEVHGDSIALAMAWWDGRENWEHVLGPELRAAQRRVVLNVPRFVANRTGDYSTEIHATRDIVVLGAHWCGHVETGRYIAEWLDYDFRQPLLAASVHHRTLVQRWGAPNWSRSRLDQIYALTLRAPVSRRRVWAVDYWDDAEPVEIVATSPHAPYVVLIAADDDLIEYATTRRQELGHAWGGRTRSEDRALMLAARVRAQSIVQKLPQRQRQIIIASPADDVWPDKNLPSPSMTTTL